MENVDLCGRKFWYIQSGRLPGQNKTLVKTLIRLPRDLKKCIIFQAEAVMKTYGYKNCSAK